MTTEAAGLGLIHKILMFFIIINIIGDIGNVALWWAIGAFNERIAGIIILLIVAAVYVIALFGLLRKLKWAPLLVIAISVANRALAFVIYLVSPAFAFWAVWTVIIVVLAYLDWRKMKSLP